MSDQSFSSTPGTHSKPSVVNDVQSTASQEPLRSLRHVLEQLELTQNELVCTIIRIHDHLGYVSKLAQLRLEILKETLEKPSGDGIVVLDNWVEEINRDIQRLGINLTAISSMEQSLGKLSRLGKTHTSAIINNHLKKELPEDIDLELLSRSFLTMLGEKHAFRDFLNRKLIYSSLDDKEIKLTEREMKFLELACTELTYRQIADKMCVSPKTVDGYRKSLFEKLSVKSRVGLVMYAVNHSWV